MSSLSKKAKEADMKEFYTVSIEDLEGWGTEDIRYFTTLEAAKAYVKKEMARAKAGGAVGKKDVPKDDRVNLADKYGDEATVNLFVWGSALYIKLKNPIVCVSGNIVDSEGNILRKGKQWTAKFSALRFQIFKVYFEDTE